MGHSLQTCACVTLCAPVPLSDSVSLSMCLSLSICLPLHSSLYVSIPLRLSVSPFILSIFYRLHMHIHSHVLPTLAMLGPLFTHSHKWAVNTHLLEQDCILVAQLAVALESPVQPPFDTARCEGLEREGGREGGGRRGGGRERRRCPV